MTKLHLQRHADQVARWPHTGRHIPAHFDDETVVVYQAYRPEIGHYAAKHGCFGGAFSLSRMSCASTSGSRKSSPEKNAASATA